MAGWVMNRTEKPIAFALKYNRLAALAESRAHSITTFRFRAE